MTKDNGTDQELFFPQKYCKSCFSELSLWTSIEDCLAAARFIERRTLETDCFDQCLVVPIFDNSAFEAVLIKCLEWLIATYRVPEIKIQLAKLIEPSIQDNALQSLRDVRFRPKITAGAAGSTGQVAYRLKPELADRRFFVIEDEPFVIGLIQNPIRCLLDLLTLAWSTAEQAVKLKREAEKTGGPPMIFHQPYSDGPLFAIIEALVFYACGLDLGPIGSETRSGINNAYRSVEIVGRPPIDSRLFEVAQTISERLFASLA